MLHEYVVVPIPVVPEFLLSALTKGLARPSAIAKGTALGMLVDIVATKVPSIKKYMVVPA